MRSSADDVRMTYVPADDVWITYPPADDVPDDVPTCGRHADDIPDDICHLPAKSPTKSHSHVVRMSSARHPHVVCTRLQFPDYFKSKSRDSSAKNEDILVVGESEVQASFALHSLESYNKFGALAKSI